MNSLESVQKVEEAASHINKVVEEQENMQKLLEFQRYLSNNEPVIITPGRKLIKEGTLMKMLPKSKHSEKLYIVLMNDIIVFCKMKKSDLRVHSLKCSDIFPLNKCKIVEILDKGCFKIICQEEEIILYHLNFNETKDWIINIKQAVARYLDDRKTLRKENSSRRPVKRKDLKEYNEIGLSPGKPLKKRKTLYIDEMKTVSALGLEKSENSKKNVKDTVSPLLITLKPNDANNDKENNGENSNTGQKDLFVFGASNNYKSFSFRVNKFFSSVGESVKKLLGLN